MAWSREEVEVERMMRIFHQSRSWRWSVRGSPPLFLLLLLLLNTPPRHGGVDEKEKMAWRKDDREEEVEKQNKIKKNLARSREKVSKRWWREKRWSRRGRESAAKNVGVAAKLMWEGCWKVSVARWPQIDLKCFFFFPFPRWRSLQMARYGDICFTRLLISTVEPRYNQQKKT